MTSTVGRLAGALLLAWILGGSAGASQDLQVAVASNFQPTLQRIARLFEQQHGQRLVLRAGSSGKHYAQIVNGAPTDLFFSADAERAERLEREGIAAPATRFTYAIGRLVLWSLDPGLVDDRGDVLRSASFRHLAIANPRLAPYGAAARAALTTLGLWPTLQPCLVFGENIAQTLHFVSTGNAELGLIARAQVLHAAHSPQGSHWLLPQDLYPAVQQQAVIVRDSASARAFMAFVRSAQAGQIILDGYDLPVPTAAPAQPG